MIKINKNNLTFSEILPLLKGKIICENKGSSGKKALKTSNEEKLAVIK